MQEPLPEINISNLDDWEMSFLQQDSEQETIRKEVFSIATSNPSHLFWVPASQHPEIAPAEFEKYVDALGYLVKRKGDKRRQSILSEYFTANDSSSQESQIKLRRSVKTHTIPDFLVFDRNSSSFDPSRAIVPKGDRNSLHRRGARTNFRKASLQPTTTSILPSQPSSSVSIKKPVWSWSFWSEEKRKNKVDPLENTHIKSSIPTRKFSFSLFSKKSKSKPKPVLDVPQEYEMSISRLPLQVERAIYKLSHTKLTKPRRPLYQQVLISNLMFWYLSVTVNDQVEIETTKKQGNTPFMSTESSTGFIIPEKYLNP
ncbi:hypothetical protein CU098_004397 [Rhizopus stolonifer]|uniref:Protein Zds1 C-terminal domain-containing protein n=1 Tax=Rhizopus stolonifer TaxID=4846 RepID=A0A367IMD9_RHIST|nr:hypothetical protein CU098_004397 [Rhizopus stolonifer]